MATDLISHALVRSLYKTPNKTGFRELWVGEPMESWGEWIFPKEKECHEQKKRDKKGDSERPDKKQ